MIEITKADRLDNCSISMTTIVDTAHGKLEINVYKWPSMRYPAIYNVAYHMDSLTGETCCYTDSGLCTISSLRKYEKLLSEPNDRGHFHSVYSAVCYIIYDQGAILEESQRKEIKIEAKKIEEYKDWLL